MRASSSRSSSGWVSSSIFSSPICLSKSSRWERMETYSPAAMEKAPASRPATPARRMVPACGAAPATPTTRLRLEISPSLMPKMLARRAPPPPRRCQLSCRAMSEGSLTPARRGPRPPPGGARPPADDTYAEAGALVVRHRDAGLFQLPAPEAGVALLGGGQVAEDARALGGTLRGGQQTR